MSELSTEDILFNEVLKAVKKRLPSVSTRRLERAYRFAKNAHEGQFRMSGEPYICHPVETAKILTELNADEDTLIAALLHDVPEDTEQTLEDIETRFGKNVAKLVSALTKLSKVHYRHSMDERQVDNLRKMFLETAQDVRAVVVKLADRLHNLRTIRYLRPEKQQRIAKETLEIFSPLANLYGIFKLQQELEDACFAVLQPEEHGRIQAFLVEQEHARDRFMKKLRVHLKKVLHKAGIKARVEGRNKHFYSIYQKTLRRKKNLADIYDYFAIRIIVENEDDCYRVLGLVHGRYRPKPGRFKDYIAFPKPNGYQSLHTTVVGPHGNLTEIQIRTEKMHREAEFGAASHLLYKGWKGDFVWEIVEQLKRYRHPETFIKHLQDDLLQSRIYVFSASGDIVHLPVGATCLDFVYAMDIPIGDQVLKPVVNGKVYSLLGTLQSGDYVQINHGNKKQNGPERIWLEHVKTTKAKEKIMEHLRHQSPKTKVGLGTRLLQQQLDHENQGLIHTLEDKRIVLAVRHYRAKDFEEILEEIGTGTYSPHDVYQVMFPEVSLGVFARVNRFFRLIKKSLESSQEGELKYHIRVYVEAYDRVGLLRDLMECFYSLQIPVIRIKGYGHDIRTEQAVVSEYISQDWMDIYIEDHEQLIALFDRLEKVPGVTLVKRVFRKKQASFVILAVVTFVYFIAHPFAIHSLIQAGLDEREIWLDVIIYGGLFGFFLLMMWVRSLGNKTFPHFEETKWFWPISFFLSLLAIGTLIVDNAFLDLDLQWPLMLAFAFLILMYVYGSYRLHSRRRTRHLNRLKGSERRK